MATIYSSARPKATQLVINGSKAGTPSHSIESEAFCTVYNRFVCEKCGHDSGWKTVKIRATKSTKCVGVPDEKDVTTAKDKIYTLLRDHIAKLEAMPETVNRSPYNSYMDIESAQCSKCKHTQSWWRQQEANGMTGCGFCGVILGAIGILLIAIWDLQGIGSILCFAGLLGLIALLCGLIENAGVKQRMNIAMRQGKYPYAHWSFAESAPN
jgi:hypothetical protein